jgi:hypothetical protein
MAYGFNRIYGDSIRATPDSLFEDRALLDDVGNWRRNILNDNIDTELAAQELGLSLRAFVYFVEPRMCDFRD